MTAVRIEDNCKHNGELLLDTCHSKSEYLTGLSDDSSAVYKGYLNSSIENTLGLSIYTYIYRDYVVNKLVLYVGFYRASVVSSPVPYMPL